jgi:DNA repair exonuclease SbcCD ATPase subunit
MQIKSVFIKGLHNVSKKTYGLKNFSYFHGPNGKGKSTALNAIQLALLGYIPGTNKNKESIMSHSNGDLIEAAVSISDGEQDYMVCRRWERKGKEIEATVQTIPEGIDIDSILGGLKLPILDFNEFIGMTSNKLKDWFIEFLPNSGERIDWLSILSKDAIILSPNDKSFIKETAEYANDIKSEGVNQVRTFNAYLKEEISAKKAENDRLQKTIQSLVYYDDCDTSADVYTLNQELAKTRHQREDVVIKRSKLETNNRLLAQIQSLVIIDNKDELVREEEQLQPLYESLKVEKESLLKMQAEYLSKIKQYRTIVDSDGICPFTGEKCESFDIPDLKNKLAALSASFKTVDSKLKETVEQLSTTDRRIGEIVKMVNNYHKNVEQKAQLESNLDKDLCSSSLEDINVEIMQLDGKIQELTTTIEKVQANQQYSELADNLTKEKFKLTSQLNLLQQWYKLTGVNGLQSRLMDAPFEDLEKSVSTYLQAMLNDKDINAKFLLSEKANSFNFGITSPFVNYRAFGLLSSGEKCIYVLALLIAIVEKSSSPLKMILLDDLLDHLDKDRSLSVFETLSKIDSIQSIMAGVIDCIYPSAIENVISL